jgi:hypothetical protein
MTKMRSPSLHRAVWQAVALLAMIGTGCGKVSGSGAGVADAGSVEDAPVIEDATREVLTDGPPSDAPSGSKDNPARTCAELHSAGMPSGVYWLLDPATPGTAFAAYCEQTLNGGGWVLMENSVRRADGKTTAFWQFKFADRFKEMGALAVDQNYYNGALYLIGREYMDVIVDMQGKTQIAAVMAATGITTATMRFINPSLTVGNQDVYEGEFASGWSAQDFDGDDTVTASDNCATLYNKVAQHYQNCWAYSLGSDGPDTADRLDGGVGPHVHNPVLTALALSIEATGNYSQVRRIARLTRW